MERTLMIVKPDAVAKNATGQIIVRVEGEGFVLRELRMIQLQNNPDLGPLPPDALQLPALDIILVDTQ